MSLTTIPGLSGAAAAMGLRVRQDPSNGSTDTAPPSFRNALLEVFISTASAVSLGLRTRSGRGGYDSFPTVTELKNRTAEEFSQGADFLDRLVGDQVENVEPKSCRDALRGSCIGNHRRSAAQPALP